MLFVVLTFSENYSKVPPPMDRREGLVSRPKGAPKIPVGETNFYSPPSKDRREGLKILLKTPGLCCILNNWGKRFLT
jgi:hypothetical protein